ncbi:MAG: hypothetical protein JXA30_06295 [Deltaproteobacteria bacterium]|nr:hypothetical protein [Deltaproteobacteria bacterium]
MFKFEYNDFRCLCAILTFVVLAALDPGAVEAKCRPGNTLAPGEHVFNIDFGGMSRVLNVHVPSSYTGLIPVALVFDLHGFSSNGPQQMGLSGFTEMSDEYGFIVVAPTGYLNSWNGDIAFGSAYTAGLDDVGLMKAIVKYISDMGNINRGKVYATGLSNGAAMSNTLGCQATDTFAAVAPVADPLDIGLDTCKPSQPTSVLGFHGYDDPYVPYEGGRGSGPALPEPFPSIQETLQNWATIMNCSGTAELVQFEGTNKCEIFRSCGAGTQVGYCSLQGGHVLYSQPYLNIAEYAWEFFDQFTLPLPDADGDRIPDEDDNCVAVANADQTDSNSNCVGDACECTDQAGCDDGLFCNGLESCVEGACQNGADPCASNQSCDEQLDQCVTSSTTPDAGAAGASGAAGAAGAAAGASGSEGGLADAGLSGASGTGTSGQSGVDTGGAVAPGADNGSMGAAGTDVGAQQSEAKADSGCGCHVLGKRSESLPPFWCLLGLLAIGIRILRTKNRVAG